MKIDKLHFENDNWLVEEASECDKENVDIVFVFADIDALKNHNHTSLLRKIYPNAHVVGSSTAGNILDDAVSEYPAVATAISFDKGKIAVNFSVINPNNLHNDAKALIDNLEKENLKHVFVLAQGLKIDGSDFVKGLNSDRDITVTGALAGDSFTFEDTYVIADELSGNNIAVAIGFYGDSLHIGIGCKAGWEEFGAKRVVTKAIGNVVYEIDNKPALELYKMYLGEYIKDLPASGLLFPLSVKTSKNDKNEVIRVMMGINADQSIIFAGDVPQESEVRLMKTNIDNLVDGAALVANSIKPYNSKRSLALTVSCSGRRSVLKQLVDEEIEVMQKILGESSQMVGLYAYGEIAPFSDDLLNCELHNQTMTITTIYEG